MRPIRGPLLLLFFLSGLTGLVYEVVWTRLFSIIFGSTALAVSSVLAAFMAGLALGSRYFGRLIDRRGEELRIYGALEIGVGVSALLLLPGIAAIGWIFVEVYRAWHPSFFWMSLIRFGLSFALLVVPTALMGGTLPVLVRYWVRARDDVGRSMGHLYAVNTLGAMAGCFAAGFWAIATFGARGTVFVTAALNVVIGAIAVGLGRRRERVDLAEAAPVPEGPSPLAAEAATAVGAPSAAGARLTSRGVRIALVAIGLSGFLALAYEVVWTRVLLYVLSASVHAFTIMLTTFLGGLALGSLLLARRIDRLRSGFRLFGVLEIGIGIAALGTVLFLSRFPAVHDFLLILFRVRSWTGLSAVKFVEAALIILVPTLLMGMTFPLVTRLYARDLPRLGSRVGNIIAVNTLGAVLGSFAAGFLLIPLIGTQATIVLLAVGNALLGGVLLVAGGDLRGPRAALAVLAPAALVLGLGLRLPENAFLPVFGINLRGGEIAYCEEGMTGTVTIHDSGGTRLLSINGADVAGTSLMLRTTQKLQAHIPLLLHPEPRSVLQVGLGSGETARSILLHPVERLVGCDISPEVIEAGAYFDAINRNVYENPRLDIVIEDAKNFVTYTEETYDLIMNDSVHPIFRGSSDLYARDYFVKCRNRLADGGMMSSWFPTALLSENDLKMLLRTFQDVFPQCSVWMGTNCVTRNALLLGWTSEKPFEIDFLRVARRIRSDPAVQADLAEVNLPNPFAVIDCFVLDSDAIREYVRESRVNTYDRPYMEFSAPKVLAAGDRTLWARNVEAMAARRSPILPRLVNLGDDEETRDRVRERLRKRREASAYILRGLVHEIRQRPLDAHAEYTKALDILPRDPIAHFLLASDERSLASLEDRVAAGTTDIAELLRLAREYRTRGRAAEAAELCRSALELDPAHPRAHRELAPLLYQLGEAGEARRIVDRAIELDPRYAGSYAIRGRLKADGGDLSGAEADLRRAADEGAAPPWAEALLAEILESTGRGEDALAHYRAALDLDPERAETHNRLALVLIERPQGTEEALAAARRAVELEPEDGYFLDTLGWIQFSAGRPREARATLQKALESLPPGDRMARAAVSGHLGQVLLALGEDDAAREKLDAALELASEFPGVEEVRRARETLESR